MTARMDKTRDARMSWSNRVVLATTAWDRWSTLPNDPRMDRVLKECGVRDLLAEVAEWEARAAEVELVLRKEWWVNHDHDYSALYGDDGEMQCLACPADFKRDPLDVLQGYVMVGRAARAREAMDALEGGAS